MATDNETVTEAIAAVRKMIHDCPAIKGGIGEFRYQLKANGAIDRIVAAHKREMDHRALIAGVYLAEAEDDAHKRELAAKDREIKELRETINMDSASMAGKDAVIAELRECLKEVCDTVCSDGLVGCKGTFAYGSKCCWRKALEGSEDAD